MPRHQTLDLSFPQIPVSSKETPLNLAPLLYKGGASLDRKNARRALEAGSLGKVLPYRRELVQRCHEAILTKLIAGGSLATARAHIKSLEEFFRYGENRPEGARFSMDSVQGEFLEWTDWLLHRHLVAKELTASTVYGTAMRVGATLDAAFERPTPLIELTRIRSPRANRGMRLEQQDLEATFSFGHLLGDLCDGLSLQALEGPRPLTIPLRAGGQLTLWAGLNPRRSEVSSRGDHLIQRAEEREARYLQDRSHRGRVVLVNTRLEAEMLMFIGQTGMNLGQAVGLTLKHFCYVSDIDGYQVRDYKGRRGGGVLFEIFREYRVHFERYLKWRAAVFPDSHLLFPFIRQYRREDDSPVFWHVKRACEGASVAWVAPRTLRLTRVNWLLRRSGDVDLVAEMAQHRRKTLLRSYEKPSLQRAVSEVTRFWRQTDPQLKGTPRTVSTAPGVCGGKPSAANLPASVPAPDCVRPSGCLWCDHHRDIDSLDHVWALVSFRHLKIIESSKQRPSHGTQAATPPVDHAIEMLSAKLSWFRESNALRQSWVREALDRVEEGSYHADWSRLIASMEGAEA